MKKLLVIFLLTFAVIVGFSGSVAATPVYHGHSHFSHAQIINSPGSTLAGGNVISKTGGDTFNVIGGKGKKSTTNIGSYIKTIGNTVY